MLIDPYKAVNKNVNIEKLTWYKPSASVPIVRESQILNTKPKSLVIPEKNIIKKTVLNSDFITI